MTIESVSIDNQLLITWAAIIIAALGLDLAAYLFLRTDWQKKGVTLTDRFWNHFYATLRQILKRWQNGIAVALVKYHQASITPEPKPVSKPVPEPEPVVPETVPVEIIPVSVKNIGSVRRVQFSLDMPLDTQVEVRIGATREAGVKVEKREL